MTLLLAALALLPARAAAPVEALTTLSSTYTRVSPVVTPDVAEAIVAGSWGEVVKAVEAIDHERLNTAQQREADFLWIWAQVHAGRAEKAAVRLDVLDGVLSVPPAYVELMRGELLLADGKPVEALQALEKVPEDSPIHPRAAIQRAKTLKELNRTAEATEVFETLASREDPIAGNELALWALAQAKGLGTQGAYPYLRRLWMHYPTTTQGKQAQQALGRYTGSAYAPTRDERSIRSERLMYLSQYADAIAEADALLAKGMTDDMATCRALYVRGRSYYKKNQLSNAVGGFGDAGKRCVNADGGYGPKSLYLIGTAQFRRKRHQDSAQAYQLLTDNYADHSMVDDGLTRAGISLQEAGELEAAQQLWQRALDDHPEGDTVPEATWRLAWSLYLDGDVERARDIAKRLAELDTEDSVYTEAGRYWHARWAAYPDVSSPATLNEAGKQEAIDGLRALVESRPWSFYAILAMGRLKELAPDVHATLQGQRAQGELERPWEVRVGVLEHPVIRDGVALARLGLSREAETEWERYEGELLPDEVVWLHGLRSEAGDWLLAHQDLRRWMKSHPPETMGEGVRAIVRQVYPDRYWAEVQQAAKGHSYDPRLFHSLVREESNFNRRIVSFAGARGLSQLMPATARTTAGWMGRSVTMDDLFVPEKNLPIGARYLDSVIDSLDGSPYCALAGYNAGPFRVKSWHGEWGNVPTDEFVERIPFRETRGYVKRVMGTWQMYRYFIGDEEPFYDLSAYNHKMLPKH